MTPQAVFVGIDGGASKTAAVCCDGEGHVLAAHRTGGCAIVGVPSPAEAAVLGTVAAALCRQAGIESKAIAGWGVGLSGIDFADEFEAQRDGVARALGILPERLALANDGIPALWGATPAPASAILQHGSGVTAAVRTCHGQERLFDHLNVGKQYDIRHELLAMVERMLDGRREMTPLCSRVLSHLGIQDPKDYAEAVYRERIPWVVRMGTAPLVYEAWLGHDPAARELVANAIEDYARTAAALGRQTGSAEPEIVMGGGVIAGAPEGLWKDLGAAVCRHLPGARVRRPILSAEYGGVLMAAFVRGGEPGRLFGRLASAAGKAGGT